MPTLKTVRNENYTILVLIKLNILWLFRFKSFAPSLTIGSNSFRSVLTLWQSIFLDVLFALGVLNNLLGVLRKSLHRSSRVNVLHLGYLKLPGMNENKSLNHHLESLKILWGVR